MINTGLLSYNNWEIYLHIRKYLIEWIIISKYIYYKINTESCSYEIFISLLMRSELKF